MKRLIMGLFLILTLVFFSGCKSDGQSKGFSNPFSSREKKVEGVERQIAALMSDADAAARAKKPHDARMAYEKILELYASNPDVKRRSEPYCRLGVLLEGFGQTDQALRRYNEAQSINPDDPFPYNCLGYCYLQQGDTDRAIQCLEKAVALEPMTPKFSNNLALAYGAKRDYDRAFQCFRRVTTEADAYYNMSAVFAMNNEEVEAKRALHRAVELDPGHRNAQRLLTSYQEFEQNPEEFMAVDGAMLLPGNSVPYREGQAGAVATPTPTPTTQPYHKQYGSVHRPLITE